MKKSILLAVIVLLLTSSSLFAKTIWIKDETNNHPSMVTFYNALIEDLKLTQYKQNIKTVTNDDQIKKEKGDIIITMLGEGLSTNTGNVSWYSWIGCVVDDCNNWAYARYGGGVFTDHYIYETSREIRIKMVKFIDKYF